MESTVMNIVQKELLMITLVFIFGLIAMKVSEKMKIPDVALFMVIGMLIGPEGLHLVTEPINSVSYQFIIVLGSILILYDGGRGIDLSVLKNVWITIGLLSVLGVIISILVVSAVAYMILDIPLLYAILLASVIASTDPATLIPVFKQVPIQAKVRQTVESESAFNDATGSIFTFSVLAMILHHTSLTVSEGVKEFFIQAGGGILIGLIVGYIGILLISQHRIGFFRKHAHLVGALMAIGSYLLAGFSHASGFMATFTAGVISGNPDIFNMKIEKNVHENKDRFGETATLIMRTLIFILLGSQVNFSTLFEVGWQGLLIVAVFMFVARPLSVLFCTLPDRKAKWKWKEILFMFWVRETGVIPAALSGMIVATGIKHANTIASITFIAILITILLQASTTGYVATRLGLVQHEKVEEKC